MTSNRRIVSTMAATIAASMGGATHAQVLTSSASQVRGDSLATNNGWNATAVFTVGESIGGYTPPGILDGMAAYPMRNGNVRVLVSHELTDGAGYTYALANGTMLTGARISFFDIDPNTKGVMNAGPAYGTVYDRSGAIVTSAGQINEDADPTDGFDRFCSSAGYLAGQYGFVDNIYFANEETGTPGHPHGGSVWALHVNSGAIWGVPQLGRGGWENVAAFDSGSPNHIALLLADDTAPAPLYLYIGQKNAIGDNSFLDRNGLAVGQVYAWESNNGDKTPQHFNASNGLGLSRTGSFTAVNVQDIAMAGNPGYDAAGYLDDQTLRDAAFALGAFRFSRPEDLHANPANGSQLVFASTGRGQLYSLDNWGDLLVVNMNLTNLSSPTAMITILHDADALPVPDQGVRSPDNLTWASDGFIYVQEDKSTSPGSLFGGATGIEASIWKVNPVSGEFARIFTVDRSAVPAGQTDSSPGDLGNWETSGVIDVGALFGAAVGETLLLANSQAHSITSGPIAANGLVQGGQLFFLSNRAPASCPSDVNGDGFINVTDLLAIISAWGACP